MTDTPKTKLCTSCLKRKPLTQFDERPSGGPKSYCRACASELATVWKKAAGRKKAARKKTAAKKKATRKKSTRKKTAAKKKAARGRA